MTSRTCWEGNAHLSVMATCSSMAEPVLDFQLPDMEVLLKRVKHTFALRSQWIWVPLQNLSLRAHVGLVVGADLLDSDVVLGVHEGLGGGVGLGQSHHAGDVLELHVVVHLHLDTQEKLCAHKSGRRGQRRRTAFLPFRCRSGRGQSSQPQEMTACSPNVREEGLFPFQFLMNHLKMS